MLKDFVGRCYVGYHCAILLLLAVSANCSGFISLSPRRVLDDVVQTHISFANWLLSLTQQHFRRPVNFDTVSLPGNHLHQTQLFSKCKNFKYQHLLESDITSPTNPSNKPNLTSGANGYQPGIGEVIRLVPSLFVCRWLLALSILRYRCSLFRLRTSFTRKYKSVKHIGPIRPGLGQLTRYRTRHQTPVPKNMT